jgi:hypothetical protein
MLRALLRFVLIDCLRYFLSGLSFIIFDHEEICGCTYKCRKQRKKNFRKRVLIDYLNKCHRQVYESEKNEKRLDKD